MSSGSVRFSAQLFCIDPTFSSCLVLLLYNTANSNTSAADIVKQPTSSVLSETQKNVITNDQLVSIVLFILFILH